MLFLEGSPSQTTPGDRRVGNPRKQSDVSTLKSHFEKGQSLVSFENFKEGNFPTDREVDVDCHGAEVRRAEENTQSLSSGKTL